MLWGANSTRELMMGRKPVKASLKRSHKVQVTLTKMELQNLEKAMGVGGFATASDYLREAHRRFAADLLPKKDGA
jgi:hypothetical protein